MYEPILLKRKIDKAKETPRPSPRELAEILKGESIYALDIEGSPKDPPKTRSKKLLKALALDRFTNKLEGVSIALEDGRAWYFNFDGENPVSMDEFRDNLNPIFTDKSKTIALHNASFDLLQLMHRGFKFDCNIVDTMVGMWYVEDSFPKGLKRSVRRVFGHHMASFEESSEAGYGSPEFHDYATEDSHWTLKLWKWIKEELTRRGTLKAFLEIHMEAIWLILEMQHRGIKIDVNQLKVYQLELEAELREIEDKISKKAGREINPRSTFDVATLLFKDLGLPATGLPTTASGGVSTNKLALTILAGRYKVPQLILSHRDISKKLSAFVKPLIQKAESHGGRIYATINIVGTETGRLSFQSPNLQQIPAKGAGKRMRMAFIAGEGRKIIDADFGQLELRLLAHFSGDPRLIEAYTNDEDIHQKTADLVGCKRPLGKALNFLTGYGGGPERFSNEVFKQSDGEVKVSIEEAKRLLSGYFRAYYGLSKFQSSERRRISNERFVKLPISKRVRHALYETDEMVAKGAAYRELFNSRVQGTAAELTLIAMRNFRRLREDKARENPKWNEVYMLLQIHDEIVLEAPEEIAEEVTKELGNVMSSACRGFRVPIQAEGNFADSWLEAK